MPPPAPSLRTALADYRAGRLAEALDLCRDLLRIDPGDAGAVFLVAAVAAAQGRTADAIALFRRVLVLAPDAADAYANLAGLLAGQGQAAPALVMLDRALALSPLRADRWTTRGTWRLGQRGGAIADFQRALAVDPASHAAWRGMGHARRGSGDPAAAARAFDRAVRLDPTLHAADSEALIARLSCADWSGLDDHRQRLVNRIKADGGVVLPLLNLLIVDDPALHLRAAALFRSRHIAAAPPQAPLPTPPTGIAVSPRGPRRLTVAYSSADFHDHATAFLVAELFERHDRDGFRIIALSSGRDDGGRMRQRIQGGVDGFVDIAGWPCDRVADRLRTEGVDILVDLKGYTNGARLDLLAGRLAPIQVAYLGYPGTLGGGPIDYLIGDPVVTPPDHQPFYAERLVILPDCYQVNDRQRPRPPGPADRSGFGLPAHGFVFGALHAPHKITPEMFGCWMGLLAELPDSRLWLYDPHGAARDMLRRAAVRHGIDQDRLVFAGWLPLADHLARYRAVDLCLDSFPYTGHTTTSDALWMGVPVVTCLGRSFAARVAASLLQAAGVPDLVTRSLADYGALALSLARGPDRLAAIRRRLATMRETAPLFDTPRFTRHLETAYRLMWERHAAGLPPVGFHVPPLPAPAPDEPRR
ncbi:MAG: hypothetical protein RLY86_1024 [Pseudomonadota bacterium]|jgi:predicted O-linked N-acetylglucosamine transferase (SPINDLY family)